MATKPTDSTSADQSAPATTNDNAAATPEQAQDQQQAVNVSGRAVFAVETTAAGVVVRTAFLTQDNRLLDMPAIFPDMVYAMNVIDDLRGQVMQHFSQAAQVGAQVIANQARAQQQQAQQSGDSGDSNATTIKG